VRVVRLARVAADAERVRLRGMLTRIVTRAILGVIALMFVLGAIVFAHLAVWYWLRIGQDQTFLATTGILGGGDLLAAIILGILAARSSPGRIEREALDVRRKAIQGIGSTFSLTQLVIPLISIVTSLRRRRRE
jgi:hypothetical protein